MEHEAHTRVERPVSTVYNQWTQFESFPEFMQGVNKVTQLDPATTEWDVEIAGVERAFTADIIDQQPDRLIHWRSRTEPMQEGRVSFTPAGDATDVSLWLNFEPNGVVEQLGDKLGLVQGRVEGDLDRFKHFIEAREHATDAWRGSIPSDQNAGLNSPVTHRVEGNQP
ncbi:MAG: SRPBCC family protein [Actinomycetia bacterium]|nr:SRPBCC family protein [Actinomycetes bacterium]